MNHEPLIERPKVAFLDWAGTMSHSVFWSDWRLSAPQEWTLIQSELFANVDLVQAWMRGTFTAEEMVAPLAERSPLGPDGWMAELERSCRDMQLTDPSLGTILARIRAAGVKVVIATDNMDTFNRWTVPALGLREMADDILNSWSLGTLKNDRDAGSRSPFFHPWLERHGIDPTEAVLFDDAGSRTEEIGIRWISVTREIPLAARLRRLLATVVR